MADGSTVLVVDDESPIRRFLRTSLTVAGYSVVTAADASGALTALSLDKPDLIISAPR